MDKLKEIQNKIKEIFNNLKVKVTPRLQQIDSSFEKFMPNAKLRKVVYIAFLSLFSFMFLIIVLGIALSPLKNNSSSSNQNLFGQKPQIIQESNRPQVELNENQKQINGFRSEIDNLSFPDTKINIPLIEFNLTINQSR